MQAQNLGPGVSHRPVVMRAVLRAVMRAERLACRTDRKVDTRLPGKGNSNSLGARLVYQNNLAD